MALHPALWVGLFGVSLKQLPSKNIRMLYFGLIPFIRLTASCRSACGLFVPRVQLFGLVANIFFKSEFLNGIFWKRHVLRCFWRKPYGLVKVLGVKGVIFPDAIDSSHFFICLSVICFVWGQIKKCRLCLEFRSPMWHSKHICFLILWCEKGGIWARRRIDGR